MDTGIPVYMDTRVCTYMDKGIYVYKGTRICAHMDRGIQRIDGCMNTRIQG